MKSLDQFKAAKDALAKGDVATALSILNSVNTTRAAIEACPGCGVENLVLSKSTQAQAECSSCGALWGSKHALVKSGGSVEESTNMMKGRPEVVEKLWAIYRREDPSLTAYDINSYAMTGMIAKSALERLGIVVEAGEPMQKHEEPTWGGLKRDEILNAMLGMFKSGEEKTMIHRFSITKFEQAGEIDNDVLKAVLIKCGRDPNALSKQKLSKSETVKIEDREGMDPRIEPGAGRKHEPYSNEGLGQEKLEEIRSKNPANGATDDEMKAPKEESPKAMAKSLFFAPEGQGGSHIAGAKNGVYKSRPSLDGYVAEFYPTKNNRFVLSKNGFECVKLGEFLSREAAHYAAERHACPPLAKAEAQPEAAPQAASPAAPKLGPHFIFSAENALHPDKRTVKGDHDSVLSGIKAMGMDAHATQGKYGSEEKSIMVMNPSKSHVRTLHSLAAGLGQESGIESDGENHKLVYYHGENAGKHHQGKGTEHFDASNKPDDFYTKHPTSDSHFRHNIDFNTLHGGEATNPNLSVVKGCDPVGGVGAPKPKGDVLMKEPIKKAGFGLKPPSVAPPSVPGNKEIEAKQSAAPEAKVHSLTGAKPKADMTDKIKALHAALGVGPGGKKMLKSEAVGLLQKKMGLLKDNSFLGRLLLRKYAELGVQIDLTNEADWE